MSSLRIRIFALAALLVVLSQAGTVATFLFTANQQVTAREQRSLMAGGVLLDQLNQSHSELLSDSMRLLANDPDFKRAISDGDESKISAALAKHSKRSSISFTVLLNENGSVLSATRPLDAEPPEFAKLIQQAEERGSRYAIMKLAGGIFEMVTVPVKTPSKTVWLSTGINIGNEFARKARRLSGLDVTFLLVAGDKIDAFATSLTDLDVQHAGGSITELPPNTGITPSLDGQGREHLVLRRPFVRGSTNVFVDLQTSLYDAMTPYREIRTVFLMVSGLAVIIALLGAGWLSTSINNPLQTLLAAARRIRDGNYREAVDQCAQPEVGQLAEAFNAMQTAISNREQEISHRVRFDSLTGLPNRYRVIEELRRMLTGNVADGQVTSILDIEINQISKITSTFGQDMADELLVHVARKLRANIDSSHILARVESDQFLVVLESTNLEFAQNVADELWHLLKTGFSVHDVNISLDAVIGISCAPDHGTDPARLLVRASVAKNDAKAADQKIGIYEDGREERYVRQITLLGDLRRAASRHELILHLQAKFDLQNDCVAGAEALVRWQHPTFGWLVPDEFIPVAEQSGNIAVVTGWALAAAIKECRRWLSNGLDLSVSVNLSGHDLLDQNLPFYIREMLQAHSLDARHLTLEITEEAIVRDFARASLILGHLRDMGIRIAIDDFGTGYSSLGQLKHLPVDELKLDRSFVTELPNNRQDAAIVTATLQMARSLGIATVAEGLESRKALEWLAKQGCDLAQGFFISQPMLADEFAVWVTEFDKQHPAHKSESSNTVPFNHRNDQSG